MIATIQQCPNCGKHDICGEHAAQLREAWAAPVAAEGLDELERLRDWVRSYMRGTCHVLTLGDKCLCPLCDLDRLAAALRPPIAAEGLDVETMARDTAQDIESAVEADYTDAQLDEVTVIIRLAALRAVAEARR